MWTCDGGGKVWDTKLPFSTRESGRFLRYSTKVEHMGLEVSTIGQSGIEYHRAVHSHLKLIPYTLYLDKQKYEPYVYYMVLYSTWNTIYTNKTISAKGSTTMSSQLSMSYTPRDATWYYISIAENVLSYMKEVSNAICELETSDGKDLFRAFQQQTNYQVSILQLSQDMGLSRSWEK